MFEAEVRNAGERGQDPNERAWDIARGAETSDELLFGDWTGETLDDGTPVFDCPECGMLAVTAEEECPSLSVPRGVGHRPKGSSE